jgi:resuscitation-promoting factor RpfB
MRVRPTRLRRLRVRKAIGSGVVAAVALATGVGYVALTKDVTLVVDGETVSVRTMSARVGDLLSSEGIVLSSEDVVVPTTRTPLQDGMTVFVDLDVLGARRFAPRVAKDVGVWVMAGGHPFATKLVLGGSPEGSLSASTASGSSRIVNARVVVMGKDLDVLTNAGTVRELLSAMGIDPDRRDRVLPSPGTSLHAGIRIRYVRVDVRTSNVRVPIPYSVITRYTTDLAPGRIRVIQDGHDGVMLERFAVRREDGHVVTRHLLSRRVLVPAVPERRLVGHTTATDGVQTGEASWYYASGDGLTAAHPWLPFGTVVTVTNVATGASVQVVIDDRGPFGGRIIDLSPEAFSRIASLGQGVCRIRLTW